MKTFVVDGNYYLHRAFSVSARTRALSHIEKNTLSLFLSFICNDALLHKATHILVVFDSKRSWRHDIYKKYKANRNKGATETEVTRADGEKVVVQASAGQMVKAAKKICELAGLPVAQKKGHEGDDLIGSACACLPGPIIVGTRDKDILYVVSKEGRIKVWWPTEKVLMDYEAVIKKMGVTPKQIPDYLALCGDAVDNIPGIPNVAHGTASKWLKAHNSLKGMLRNPEIKKRLTPYKSLLVMCRKLTGLKCDIVFKHEDLIPQKIDHDLSNYVWHIPPALKELSDARKYASKKGLFGK